MFTSASTQPRPPRPHTGHRPIGAATRIIRAAMPRPRVAVEARPLTGAVEAATRRAPAIVTATGAISRTVDRLTTSVADIIITWTGTVCRPGWRKR